MVTSLESPSLFSSNESNGGLIRSIDPYSDDSTRAVAYNMKLIGVLTGLTCANRPTSKRKQKPHSRHNN